MGAFFIFSIWFGIAGCFVGILYAVYIVVQHIRWCSKLTAEQKEILRGLD